MSENAAIAIADDDVPASSPQDKTQENSGEKRPRLLGGAMKSIAFKLGLANLLPLAILVILVILAVAGKKVDLMNERKLKTRHLVEAAYGVLDHYQQQEKQGTLSGAEARKAAVEAVKGLP